MLNLFEKQLFSLTLINLDITIVTNPTVREEETHEKDDVNDAACGGNHNSHLLRACHDASQKPPLSCQIEEEGEKRELSASSRARTSDAASPMANPVRAPEARRNGR